MLKQVKQLNYYIFIKNSHFLTCFLSLKAGFYMILYCSRLYSMYSNKDVGMKHLIYILNHYFFPLVVINYLCNYQNGLSEINLKYLRSNT